MTYHLLRGIRVLEVAQLAPDMLGQHLADMGAEVIKVEEPPDGDYLRRVGSAYAGGDSLMHLRWNRGKRSLGLNLKAPEGRDVFLALAAKSHLVVDGLRAGAMDAYGAGYTAVRARNPKIVYCALSGLGAHGPYRRLPTRGVFFNAYAGLAPPVYTQPDGLPRIPRDYVQVGTLAGGLYGALGALAALVQALQTGEGAFIDVAEADAAAAWGAEKIDRVANGLPAEKAIDVTHSVRYAYYRTADNRTVLFQGNETRFWQNFCRAVERPDLIERFPGDPVDDHASGNEMLRAELQAIFATRVRAEWVEFFIVNNIAGGPVNTYEELVEDPQFKARGLQYRLEHPRAGSLDLFGTPVRVDNASFSATLAPAPGQDTESVLRELLNYGDGELNWLRRMGAIG